MSATRIPLYSAAELRARGSLKWTQHTDTDVLGAFVAEMDFGVAPEVMEAAAEVVRNGQLGYLPRALWDRHSTAVVEWLTTQYGWRIPEDYVWPIGDVITALEYVIEHFTAPMSPVVLLAPTYMRFLTTPGLLGHPIIEVPVIQEPEGDWRLNLSALEAAFEAGGELLILCNPHNPIGKMYSREELLSIASIVDRFHGRVFSDEIHAPLVYGDSPPHIPYASISEVTAHHTITGTSASKAWNMPGLKCAQVLLSNDHDLASWHIIGRHAAFSASNPGVAAAAAAYTVGRPWLTEVRNLLEVNRRNLADAVRTRLPDVSYTSPEATYLAWLDCRQLELAPTPAEFFLRRAKVALTDGAECGAAGRGWVRLNFATPPDVLDAMLHRMSRALA